MDNKKPIFVKILQDNAYGTQEKAGTILKVTNYNSDNIYTEVKTGYAKSWGFPRIEDGPIEITYTQTIKDFEGIKHDENKPDLSLLPKSAKEGIARAFMYGAKKYGRYNYLKGMDWTRLLSAADRHLSAFNDGEDKDDESTLNHLYHAGACIMMLIEFYEKKLGKDNRYKKEEE